MTVIKKIINILKQEGLLILVKKCILKIIDILKKNSIVLRIKKKKLTVYDVIHNRRIKISDSLFDQFQGIVRYGQFKGLKLSKKAINGIADLGSMLLGIYELEVAQSILNKPKRYTTLVDLGAADGYFAIGCLINNDFKKTYCFEIRDDSRRILYENAVLNNVDQRMKIYGKANDDFYVELQSEGVELSKCVILCDIEGGEFDLFNKSTLSALKDSIIIIEIHDWHENGNLKYEQLKENARKYFNISELTTKSRDLSSFPEIKELRDDDRWLLCSEGRHWLQTWLRLDPKSNFLNKRRINA